MDFVQTICWPPPPPLSHPPLPPPVWIQKLHKTVLRFYLNNTKADTTKVWICGLYNQCKQGEQGSQSVQAEIYFIFFLLKMHSFQSNSCRIAFTFICYLSEVEVEYWVLNPVKYNILTIKQIQLPRINKMVRRWTIYCEKSFDFLSCWELSTEPRIYNILGP